jgi:hypothetical protein
MAKRHGMNRHVYAIRSMAPRASAHVLGAGLPPDVFPLDGDAVASIKESFNPSLVAF